MKISWLMQKSFVIRITKNEKCPSVIYRYLSIILEGRKRILGDTFDKVHVEIRTEFFIQTFFSDKSIQKQI
jgi:hypothetical protein